MKHLISQPRRPRPARRGFSLVEAAFVTMIAGLCTVGTLQLVTAGTFANKESSELTTAINLAENIHEYSTTMSYATVCALDADTFSPPIDASGDPCSDLGSSWRQSVTVVRVNPLDLNSTTTDASSKTARVIVTVYRNNAPIHSMSWLVANPNG